MTLEVFLQAEPENGQPDAFSSTVVPMLERVQASVVQVRSAGRGMGAGVIWDANGKVLTNYHVIAAAQDAKIQVVLNDGRELPAQILGRAPQLDLALLSIEAQELPAAPFADSSQLRVGELVFAVGHPWGVRGVVTAGIVSGLGEARAPGSRNAASYIRSDVRLAPGNSGGPMLNADGAVVGINSMVFGGDLGVAIPSQVVQNWVAGLKPGRKSLGAGVKPVRLQIGMEGESTPRQVAGLQVAKVEANSLAGRGGLQVGDVLLDANGERLRGVDTLLSLLERLDVGTLEISVLRGSNIQTIKLEIE